MRSKYRYEKYAKCRICGDYSGIVDHWVPHRKVRLNKEAVVALKLAGLIVDNYCRVCFKNDVLPRLSYKNARLVKVKDRKKKR